VVERALSIPQISPGVAVFASGVARGNRISSKGATPMLDKKGRRVFFTDRQMQQLVLTNDRLRQSNGSALRELRRVGRSNLTSKKYKEADIRLQMVAAQIIGVLQLREEILISAREQGAAAFVIFEVRHICKDSTAPPEELEDHLGEEVPAPDPAHYPELDHLIEFAQRTVGRLWSGSIQRKPFPAAFSEGLRCLTPALLKQRRHLRETTLARPRTRTEFRVPSDNSCSRCHQEMKIPDPDLPEPQGGHHGK